MISSHRNPAQNDTFKDQTRIYIEPVKRLAFAGSGVRTVGGGGGVRGSTSSPLTVEKKVKSSLFATIRFFFRAEVVFFCAISNLLIM